MEVVKWDEKRFAIPRGHDVTDRFVIARSEATRQSEVRKEPGFTPQKYTGQGARCPAYEKIGSCREQAGLYHNFLVDASRKGRLRTAVNPTYRSCYAEADLDIMTRGKGRPFPYGEQYLKDRRIDACVNLMI